MGRSSTSTSTEPVTPAARGRRNGGDLVGRDAGDQRRLAADEHRVGKAKAHALNRDGTAGGGQMRGRDCVGVKHPAVVGVVGAAVAAQVGDADAHDVVAVGGHAQPGFARGEAVEAGRCANSRCAHGIECVPDADRGHGLGVCRRAGFVEGLGDDGEDAIAANGEGEPVALAHLAEPAAPQPARGHGARLGLAFRWRREYRRRPSRPR